MESQSHKTDLKMQSDFYSSYRIYKRYKTPKLSKKDITRFDAEIWVTASFSKHMTCLEIGCGTGAFVMLDVLEHFSPEEGFQLLQMIKNTLGESGKIIVKVPNASSPWGMNYQFGDLTHKAAYNGESLLQLAMACKLTVDSIYDQRNGSRRRILTDTVLHKFLSWALLTPPPTWGANLYCIFSLRD